MTTQVDRRLQYRSFSSLQPALFITEENCSNFIVTKNMVVKSYLLNVNRTE